MNGVEYFLRRWGERARDVSELDELQVCAIGEATAEKLRAALIHVDVIPGKGSKPGVSFCRALAQFVGGRGGTGRLELSDSARAAVARSYLPDALEEAGARRRGRSVSHRAAAEIGLGRINALLSGGGIGCIAFTSSSTVANFAQLFDTSDLAALLKGVAVACVGDITAGTAAEHGLQTEIMPAEYTISRHGQGDCFPLREAMNLSHEASLQSH